MPAPPPPPLRPGARPPGRWRAGWAPGLLAFVAGASLAACYLSDTYSGGQPPSAGPDAGDAGLDGDAAHDADAAPQLSACERLAQAHCQRSAARCGLSTAAQGAAGRLFCEKRAARVCEVARKLPGFAGADEALSTCASGLSKATGGGCEGVDDPIGWCALRGALPDGQACELGAQCKSGFCQGGGVNCGACATPLKQGESCVDKASLCAPGLVCRADTCQARQPKGSPCEADGHCLPGLRCIEGACKEPLQEGAVCGPDVDLCDATRALYCDGLVCKRTALSINGAPCADPPGPTVEILCEAGLRCVTKGTEPDTERVCQPQLDDGKGCTESAECLPPARCRADRCTLFGACSEAADAGSGGSGPAPGQL